MEGLGQGDPGRLGLGVKEREDGYSTVPLGHTVGEGLLVNGP